MDRLCVILMFLGAVLGLAKAEIDLDYSCTTEAVLTVVNPDVAVFKSATASSLGIACNTNISTDLTIIYISDCDKDEDIWLTLSSRDNAGATGDGIIGGGFTESFILYCKEIPVQGVTFVAGIDFGVTEEHDVLQIGDPIISTQPAVTQLFSITTVIRNALDTVTVSSATVGDTLKWIITGPYEYDLLPIACTAYSGSTTSGSPEQSIVSNGCTLDNELLLDFGATSSDSTERGQVYSWFYAFRFYNSEYLTLSCSVKICVRGSISCAQSCPARKRRSDNSVDSLDTDGNIGTVITHIKIAIAGSQAIDSSSIVVLMASVMSLLYY